MRLMILLNPKSTRDRNKAVMVDMTITTTVPSFRSALLGQVTDFISALTSRKNVVILSNFILRHQYNKLGTSPKEADKLWQDRQESNPQPPVLETGALPVELLSCNIISQRLALLVNCVFPAGGAELLQLHSVRMLAFVSGRSIITILTLFASQYDYISHFDTLYYSMMEETTPLPMVCPPSRIAKRSPCSMAMGVISSA